MGDYTDKIDRSDFSFGYGATTRFGYPSSTENEIEQIITELQGIANNQISNLSTALAELATLNPEFSPDDVYPTAPTEPSTSFSWTGDTYGSEEEPGSGDPVTMWSVLFTRMQSILEDDSLDEGTGSLFKAIKDRIITDTDGGSGMTTTIYNAIVAREQAQRAINQTRNYQKALDNVGATGFNLPSGHIAAMETELARDEARDDQAALDLLVEKDFELAVRAKENALKAGTQLEQLLRQTYERTQQLAIQSGAELEKAIRQTFERTEELSLDAAKAAKQYVIDIYNNSIAAFDSAWKGIGTEVSAYSAKASLAERIAEVRASVTAQALASALGAINTSMTWGYSTGYDVGFNRNESLSNSLTESRPFIDEVA